MWYDLHCYIGSRYLSWYLNASNDLTGEVDVGAVIKALPNVSAKQQKRLRGHVDKKQTQDFCRSFVEICGDSANALTCVDALQFCYATHGMSTSTATYCC
jgi:hypothetical protein